MVEYYKCHYHNYRWWLGDWEEARQRATTAPMPPPPLSMVGGERSEGGAAWLETIAIRLLSWRNEFMGHDSWDRLVPAPIPFFEQHLGVRSFVHSAF